MFIAIIFGALVMFGYNSTVEYDRCKAVDFKDAYCEKYKEIHAERLKEKS